MVAEAERGRRMNLSYAVVFEQTPGNYCGYAPDVPGCVSTGRTLDEMRRMMREALELHIEGMVESGEPVPSPAMSIDDAVAFHQRPDSEAKARFFASFADDEPPLLSLSFEMLEVSVAVPAAALSR